MSEFVSVEAAARLAGVSIATMRRWVTSGKVRAQKVGATWVVEANNLVAAPSPMTALPDLRRVVSESIYQLRAGDFAVPWVPDPLWWADVLRKPEVLASEAIKLIEGPGPWSEPTIVDVPRSGFLSRPAAQFDPVQAVAYHAVVRALAPEIDSRLGDSVHSARVALSGRRFLANGTEAWLAWRKACTAEVEEGRSWMVKTDVTAYFDNIEHRLLFRDLDALHAPVTPVRALKSMLSAWALAPGRGLPQGQDASRVLGNLYLLPVDQAMGSDDVRYSRYMDDLRLFTSSRAEAVRGLRVLEASLRSRGLSLSGQKTELLFGEAAIADLASDEGMGAAEYAMDVVSNSEAAKLLGGILRRSLARTGVLNDRGARFALWRLRGIGDSRYLRLVLRELDRLSSVARITAQYLLPHVRRPWVVKDLERFLCDPQRNTSPFLATWLLAALIDAHIEPPADLARFLRRILRDPREPTYLRIIAASELALGRAPGDIAFMQAELRRTFDPAEARGYLVALARAGALETNVRRGARARFPALDRTIDYLLGRDNLPPLVYRQPLHNRGQLASLARVSNRSPLTPRENEIVSLVVAGRSNGEIAAALDLSVKTVEAHLARVFDKVDVATRAELAVLAERRKWVSASSGAQSPR
jgi:DNA-binding CsgD family transcriptional regulator